MMTLCRSIENLFFQVLLLVINFDLLYNTWWQCKYSSMPLSSERKFFQLPTQFELTRNVTFSFIFVGTTVANYLFSMNISQDMKFTVSVVLMPFGSLKNTGSL